MKSRLSPILLTARIGDRIRLLPAELPNTGQVPPRSGATSAPNPGYAGQPDGDAVTLLSFGCGTWHILDRGPQNSEESLHHHQPVAQIKKWDISWALKGPGKKSCRAAAQE